MSDLIFIKGNVPSLKNSKQFYKNKKTGKLFISTSDTVKKYLSLYEYQWNLEENKKKFKKLIKNKEKPYKIAFYFTRDTKRRFDYINIVQLPLDLMQKFGWIEDDDSTNVIPYFLGYEVDKENAGVRIEIL